MLSTSLTTSAQAETIGNKLTTLASVIDEVASLVFDSQSCPRNHDIEKQIPLWIIYEKADRENAGQDGINIFDFIQKTTLPFQKIILGFRHEANDPH